MKYPKRCQYKHAKQKKYHVRNWAEYNEGLRRRGDLTVWFDEEAIANWKADKTGEPGGQRVYSDMAIETGLVVRMVYKLAYRQTEGFLHSIASLLGLGIEIPDYSTLCRRSRLLRKKLRIPKAASTQPIHLMIDSTGLRIHVGNARKPPKQRAWRKLHIAVDRETGNIVASELTASRARDATRVPALLTQIQAPLVSVAADSAYDKEAVYEAIEAHSPGRRTRVVIPPQRNATLSQNSNTAMQERDRHIRAIERHGRREWYKLSGYTKRSMVENAVYRYKAIIGPEMRARTLARQRIEHRIGCEILNKMAALGMPRYVLRRVTLPPAQGGQQFAPSRATTPVDTKKKELVGRFKNPGRVWAQKSDAVNDHDFRSMADGVAIPYGIYDLQSNRGTVYVGTSYDTSQFAVECIEKWWRSEGQKRFPGRKHLLVVADTGGSNGATRRAWKHGIQHKLCNEHGLDVTVAHYPPGASKWNPIEHRLFSEISKNWAGRPLDSYETILNFIRTTKTKTGLKVNARLVKKQYPKGIKISDPAMALLNIKKSSSLPKWNYTLRPSKNGK